MFSLQNHNANGFLSQRVVKPTMNTNYISYHPHKERLFITPWGCLNIPVVFSAYAERLLRNTLVCSVIGSIAGQVDLLCLHVNLFPATGCTLNPSRLCPCRFHSSKCSFPKSSKGWLVIHVSTQTSASLYGLY